MAKLIYSTLASLDGYVVDAEGSFAWATPDEQVHSYVNDLERGIGTHLYGRRMYEVMAYWETADPGPGSEVPVAMREYAGIWRQAEKVVYSRTLGSVMTSRTRLEPVFEPNAIRALKGSATADLSIGGPTLAAEALRAGLVDECHLFVVPVLVGGGTKAFPDGHRVALELLGERSFQNGTTHLHYAIHPIAGA
ncbi:Dihydrofolate reductase [Frankineae bacterium MT45]|nr:Dihydrofolate reductase [Frankineae bacterium MT45]